MRVLAARTNSPSACWRRCAISSCPKRPPNRPAASASSVIRPEPAGCGWAPGSSAPRPAAVGPAAAVATASLSSPQARHQSRPPAGPGGVRHLIDHRCGAGARLESGTTAKYDLKSERSDAHSKPRGSGRHSGRREDWFRSFTGSRSADPYSRLGSTRPRPERGGSGPAPDRSAARGRNRPRKPPRSGHPNGNRGPFPHVREAPGRPEDRSRQSCRHFPTQIEAKCCCTGPRR